MFLCPKCNYSYNISKNKKLSDDKISINKVNSVFKILDQNLAAYSFDFPVEKLKKSKRFIKLDKDLQKKLLDNFNSKKKVEISSIFKCSNCDNVEPITTTVKLFEIRKDKESSKELDEYEIQFYINDPTLPRTRDYNCKNLNCSTHKNNDIKEAVFLREKDSFQLKYICTVCSHLWYL